MLSAINNKKVLHLYAVGFAVYYSTGLCFCRRLVKAVLSRSLAYLSTGVRFFKRKEELNRL